MQVWSADDGNKEVVKFTAPADIKGSGFLSTTLPDGSTQSMIYLPALDRTRRIAGGQKQESFFGSDFSYEDITDLQSGTGKKYDSKLLKVDAGPVYVVEATPKPGADAAYDKLVLTIPEATLIPTRIEFYRGGALLKVMTIHETVEVDGYTLPSEFEMKTEASGSATTIRESDFKVQDTIPDEVFTERFLRR
jgi:outer membrane lipoprotein-sorting protein